MYKTIYNTATGLVSHCEDIPNENLAARTAEYAQKGFSVTDKLHNLPSFHVTFDPETETFTDVSTPEQKQEYDNFKNGSDENSTELH